MLFLAFLIAIAILIFLFIFCPLVIRDLIKDIKKLFLPKTVPPGETEKQKQARFDSGAEAGNELYEE